MERETRRFDWARLAAGLSILAIGAVLILDNAGLSRGLHFWEFWPLILIVIGITRLAGSGERGDRQGALTLTFIGCWLLIASLGLFGLDYGDSWPLVLVAIGLSILLTAGSSRRWAKGLFLVLLGAWFQITILGLFGLSLEASWPLAIVALGLWLVMSSFFPDTVGCCGDAAGSGREGRS
jgi:hypothetical protein